MGSLEILERGGILILVIRQCAEWARSILENKNGNLWFGTRNHGICRYDEKTFTNFTEKEGLGNTNDKSRILLIEYQSI